MKKYKPSNGTEGAMFTSKFCERCKNEKFIHTNSEKDRKCQIFSKTLITDVTDEEYPTQWQYGTDGRPTCTAFDYHKWYDKDGNFLDDGVEPEFIDPNQLNLF